MPLFLTLWPYEVGLELARRVRNLRLLKNWKRKTLAERSGVSQASLRRFETTGAISLESFIKLVHALGVLKEMENLFLPRKIKSMEELEKREGEPIPKRGRR